MSDLDEKLIDIFLHWRRTSNSDDINEASDMTEYAVEQIKQAFTDAGYVHTDVRDKADSLLQDMVNLHANMKHDMVRLGLMYSDPRPMTGQE